MTLHAVGTYGSHQGPVVVFLHGWGSDERDLASLAQCVPAGVAWASVRAPLRHPSFGYAWYPLDSEQSWAEQGPIDAGTDALWSWVDEELGEHADVIPVGFSQGGVMASQLLRTRPHRVPAAAVLSGYALAAAQQADAVLAQSLPPVFWGRGDRDAVIPGDAIAATDAVLPGIATIERHLYPGMAHQVSPQELHDLTGFLARVARR